MRSAPPGAPASTASHGRLATLRALPRRMPQRMPALPLALLVTLVTAGCGTTHTTPVVLPTATAQSVTLTTDFTTYSASQAIGVTVTNGSKRAYFAPDNHSECTVLQLQEQVRGVWTDVMSCNTGQPVTVLQVTPGPGVPYTLAPGNAKGNPNAWDPGVYRVALLLGTKADGSNLTTAVYSAGILIKAS